MTDSPATAETKRVFKAFAVTVLGVAVGVLSLASGNVIVVVLGLGTALFLVLKGRPALVALIAQGDDPSYLYPEHQRQLRVRCGCCGCPSLRPADDTCLLCEWPNDGSSDIPLDVAQLNFGRYLTIYAPDARPHWALSPGADLLAVREQLVHAYGSAIQHEEASAPWSDVIELENTLRSLEFNRASEQT